MEKTIAGNGLWIFPRNYDDVITPEHADAHVARMPQRAYSPAHGHRLRANATGSALSKMGITQGATTSLNACDARLQLEASADVTDADKISALADHCDRGTRSRAPKRLPPSMADLNIESARRVPVEANLASTRICSLQAIRSVGIG